MMLQLSDKSININKIRRVDNGVNGCSVTWDDGTIETFQGVDADKIKELSSENFIFRRIDFICLILALKYAILYPENLINKLNSEKLTILVNFANQLEIAPEQASGILASYRNILEANLFEIANDELINLLEVVL